MTVKLTGDWAEAERILNSVVARFPVAVERAMLQEAHFLRRQIVIGITRGSPGGRSFAPLTPISIALRRLKGVGGSKPLIATGALRSSIVVRKVGGGRVFVGVMRGGRAGANFAEFAEFGKTIRKTPKMRRFLAAVARRAGLPRTTGPGRAFIIIPPRPFIGPVLATDGKPDAVARRFWAQLAKELGGDLGTP